MNNFRSLFVASAAILFVAPVCAQVDVFFSRDAFNSAVWTKVDDNFSDLGSNQFFPDPIARNFTPFSWSVAAAFESGPANLFTISGQGDPAPVWLTTDLLASTINFTGFSSKVDAFGATFFLTDFPGNVGYNVDLFLTATFASHTQSYTITPQPWDAQPFVGFIAKGEQLLSISISADNGSTALWPTIADVSVASTSLVPEPGTSAMFLMGVALLGAALTRRSTSATPQP